MKDCLADADDVCLGIATKSEIFPVTDEGYLLYYMSKSDTPVQISN